MAKTTKEDLQPTRKKGVVAHPKNPFWEAQEVKVGSKMIKVAGVWAACLCRWRVSVPQRQSRCSSC